MQLSIAITIHWKAPSRGHFASCAWATYQDTAKGCMAWARLLWYRPIDCQHCKIPPISGSLYRKSILRSWTPLPLFCWEHRGAPAPRSSQSRTKCLPPWLPRDGWGWLPDKDGICRRSFKYHGNVPIHWIIWLIVTNVSSPTVFSPEQISEGFITYILTSSYKASSPSIILELEI